jgi:hypothetical protein
VRSQQQGASGCIAERRDVSSLGGAAAKMDKKEKSHTFFLIFFHFYRTLVLFDEFVKVEVLYRFV